MAETSDHFVDFVAGKLPALAGLSSLCHLDLQFVCIHQVIRGDSEAGGGHLLHGATPEVAVRIGLEPLLVFPALAGVRLAADSIHRDRQRFVRFFTNGPERHCACRKALYDFLGGLDFINGYRRVALFQLHQPAQRTEIRALIVDEIGVLLKSFVAVLAYGMLQLADGEWIQQMVFAADSLVIVAAHGQFGLKIRKWTESILMFQLRFRSQNIES